MKHIFFIIVLVFSALFCNAEELNEGLTEGEKIVLHVGILDPTEPWEPIKKAPVRVPSVSIEDYTLYFASSCDGCPLRLLDENGMVVYSTVIPPGTKSLLLPAYLSGDYQIQIVRGRFCFWGYIYV